MTDASEHAWDVMGSSGAYPEGSADEGRQGLEDAAAELPVSGDAVTGEAVTGEAVTGEAGAGEARAGEARATAEALPGPEAGAHLGLELVDEDGPNAVDVAEAWLAELADQASVSATDVQDHLLDLWGALDEGPARVEVERWLTETLRRNLYSVSDINERLDGLLPAH